MTGKEAIPTVRSTNIRKNILSCENNQHSFVGYESKNDRQ
jgi:hypothetical protein